ncbi:hypothetical protein JTE90_022142 [Oedothorax gibbosus]|uniref:Coiled-coil protein 142 C-terminal domain-containing protein n=1 Tax=Oedothorax gibbosus TaxID=931172 RepID=A0AAV6VTT4_9ARAC|nr:hypothetical protein JTE90_022142 [Oedothorax gibbosus]
MLMNLHLIHPVNLETELLKFAPQHLTNLLEGKKSRQVSLKRSKSADIILKTPKLESNTSDYFSDLDSEICLNKEHLVKNSDFANVLTSVIQRNQSLVLKYLYVISDLQNSKGLSKVRRPSSYDSSTSYPVRQTWSVHEQSPRDDNRIILEEIYWSTFWNHVQKFILKILLEVPYHQYGDTTAGTIILWPESFLHTLFETLKMTCANKEITLEGRQVMKQIYDTIFVQKMQIRWDKEFSLAISATHSHLCVSVPITSNKVKTHPGNLLYSCLEVGINSLHTALHSSNSLLLLKSFHNLQSTLDCFILWLNNKTRATASSYNFATYLLITRSDCSSSSELLKMKVMPLISNEDLTNAYSKVSSSKHLLQKTILNQIDIISGYETEVPNVIYNLLFDVIKDGMTSALRSPKSWILCSLFGQTPISIDIQEELIFLLSEVITGLHNSSSVITAITSAFAEASIYSLKNAKTNTSLNDVLLISSELSKHSQWIDKLNLSEVENYNLKELACLRKLNSILKYIQKLSSQHHTCLKHRNRVSPSILPEVLLEGGLLSDQEKQLWQTRCSKSWFCFCL